MKKIILYIAIAIFSAASVCAQNVKFGHLAPEAIMEKMVGFDTAQALMISYQEELQSEGQMMVKEFQAKQKEYQDKLPTYSEAVRKLKETELTTMSEKIQNFSSTIDGLLEQKKYELLLPFQEKILAAIKEIGKDENYTYIFYKSVLSYSAHGDDISEKVKQKLGIQ
ncbi:MAG: OmpH family outer membrane protein [Bacteroidales bacterium]|jgi:outer membrane protein|nr:OmpH family outer membrane protein [Bacteroidales bacterium]